MRACIPITAKNTENFIRDIKKAESLVDLIELRLDFIPNIDEHILRRIFKNKTKKVIVTCRPKYEGGHFTGTEEQRAQLLAAAIDFGAEYIDIESRSAKPIQKLLSHKKRSKIIYSYHNFEKTGELIKIYSKIKIPDADVVKIATFANSYADNLNIFFLLQQTDDLVALCMGEKGKVSRVLCPLFGSLWTYASLEKNKESAPGQITYHELIKLYEMLR